MKIKVDNVSISFYRKRIVKNVSIEFSAPKIYAIVGGNGSGKSSLMKVLAGFVPPHEGSICYFDGNGLEVSTDVLCTKVAWAAPYIGLYEEMDVQECFDFHCNFKKPLLSREEFVKSSFLEAHANKRIKFYSSGMKQRLKLALLFYFESQVLLLDEPTSNLDKVFQSWYLDRVEEVRKVQNKLLIVASNDPKEYQMADHIFNVEDYK